MKVLVISTVNFEKNGISSVILNYYEKIDKSDMEIDFVVPNEVSDDLRRTLAYNSSNVYNLHRKKNPYKYCKNLYTLIKQNKYDIVHIHGNSSTMYLETSTAKKAGVLVRIAHSHNSNCEHRVLNRLLAPFFLRSYTNGFACSNIAGKWLFGDRPFMIMKNGVDLQKFKFDQQIREEYREKLKIGGSRVIGHVGRFSDVKNHMFIIEFFYDIIKEDKNYILILIGDGETREQIIEMVKDLGIERQVCFVRSTDQVENYLNVMDVFVLPSIYEGLPVVLVEAQATGLPCVVSDTVSKEVKLTKIVNFLKINSNVNWKNKIMDIIDKECIDERIKIAQCSQMQIKEAGFDILENANRMKEVYEETLSQNKECVDLIGGQ